MPHRVPFTRLAHHPNLPYLVLANGAEYLVVNSSDGKLIKEYPKDQENKAFSQELHRNITFSKDGKRMVTTGDMKLLRVYDTDNWTLLYTRPANKRVNALQFTKDASTIVVADKFGDVHCHPAEAATEDKSMPVVGHVSMITDLILSEDEKYVITADRDEHIRVSRFPNGYNIETFCLGHTDVVTAIRLLPWKSDVLVSAGGDNTLRTWDFVKGIQLQSLNYLDFIKADLPTSSVPDDSSQTDDPIVSSMKFDNVSKTLALAFTKLPVVAVFKWNQDRNTFEFKENILGDRNVLDISFDLEGRLWTSMVPETETDPIIAIYEHKDGKYERLSDGNTLLSSVNAARVETVDKLSDFYTLLSLRKYYDQFEEDEAGKMKKRKTG